MPKVSVIMPAYNAEKYIAEAIDSILCQTFGDFEFIILNDCSKDRTEQIILSYKDERIVYLKNEQNMGVAATLNKGLRVAKGEYIARMDADDVSLPERFEKQVAYLDSNTAVTVLGTNVQIFDEKGNTKPFYHHSKSDQLKIDLLFDSCFAHPSVMMRRDEILALGGYDREYEGMEDYELWCRVAQEHDLANYPSILLRYRIHSAQVTQQMSPRKALIQKKIRSNQLHRLTIPEEGTAAEAYYGFSIRSGKDLECVMKENAFFEAVLEANKRTGRYDQKLLRKTFGLLMKSNAMGLPKKQRWQVCRQSKLLHGWQLMLSEIKSRLKNR